jgi:xanthine dehydrogenase accessory factor
VAVPLAELAKVVGFRVTVVDARGQWANRARFPKADEIVVGYADDFLATARLDLSTYVVVLTHDPKLDDPAIIEAVKHDVRYIGAIGSRRTHAGRIERLKAVGATDEQLAKIHAPIGLDIRARNPEEIAVSVLAEMIAAKNGVETLTRHSRPRVPAPA